MAPAAPNNTIITSNERKKHIHYELRKMKADTKEIYLQQNRLRELNICHFVCFCGCVCQATTNGGFRLYISDPILYFL